MIYYLTYNEPFSGIFNSQVVDVVKHLRTEHQQEIRLISFVPIGFKMTYYKELSAKLRKAEPNCIIIPTVPVQYGWKFNWILLSLILLFRKKGSIISREVQATYLAIKCRAIKMVYKVCYDARGANYAQMKEYDIYSPNVKGEIFELEKFAVFNANFRLAVSEALVDYWKRFYNYSSNQYVVIPTTISSSLVDEKKNTYEINRIKNEFNFKAEDVILVFSGSNFGWQSFDLVIKFFELQLQGDSKVKVVFLTQVNKQLDDFISKFPNRIYCKWLQLDEVNCLLELCDYGVLLRDSNDTNNVASPTKFAEYLAAGLPVIVSDNLDFARIVKSENCGILVQNDQLTTHKLIKNTKEIKINMKAISSNYFLKSSPNNKLNYEAIIRNLNDKIFS